MLGVLAAAAENATASGSRLARKAPRLMLRCTPAIIAHAPRIDNVKRGAERRAEHLGRFPSSRPAVRPSLGRGAA